MAAPLLHVTSPAAWSSALASGAYTADTLATEGFIHCSTAAQVVGVVDRLFSGGCGAHLLVVDPDRLTSEVRWEESEPGQAPFPHVYGPIDTGAVIEAMPWSLVSDRGPMVVVRAGAGTVAKISTEGAAPVLDRDAACLRFITSLGDPLPAARYVSSRPGVVAMEELTGPTVADVLVGHDRAAAASAMVAWGEAVGRLHAMTAGKEASFGPAATDWRSSRTEAVAGFVELAASVGVDASPLSKLVPPTPIATALTHGDPCPDNVFVTDGRAQLIDFVYGGYRGPAHDAVFVRLPWPSCWCCGVFPVDVVDRAEDAYRAAAVDGLPHLGDDVVWRRELAAAAIGWTLDPDILQKVMHQDRRWGIAHGRPRVLHWLTTTAALCDDVDDLGPVTTVCRSLADALRNRWPDAGELAGYPAFN